MDDVPIHSEEIVLTGVDEDETGQVQVSLRTTTTLARQQHNDDDHYGDGDSDSHHEQMSLLHLHPVNSILISIMERFNLQSLTISVSSKSSSMTKLLDGDSHSHVRNFPVGTAVQFTTRTTETSTMNSSTTGGEGNYNDNSNDIKTKIEYDLMRILSSKNLFCENVQLEPFYNGIIEAMPKPRDMDMNTWRHERGTGSKNATKKNVISKIIMLPNDAFSLCHTRALWDKIISSTPCRDRAGVYSHLQWDLNGIDIVDKASWIHLERSIENTRRSVVEIEKGLDYTRWMSGSSSSSSSGRSLSKLLTGERYNGSNTDDNTSTFKHCPLTESSTMTVYDANGGSATHDLEGDDYDLNNSIDFGSHRSIETQTNIQSTASSSIHGHDTTLQANNDSKVTTMGIERHVVRLNGVANGGMLQTRAYFHHNLDEADSSSKKSSVCGGDESIHVNIVDVFPKFISPIYHTMRILLVEGDGAGSGK